MKKLYLADIFRKAADGHLMNADDIKLLRWLLRWEQGKSQFSCCAVVNALDDIFKTASCIIYTKKKRLKVDYRHCPHHYFVLDWMGECGVKCGSRNNFKNSDSMYDKEAQAFRFMWLEMLAVVAEDEGVFIEV